MALSDNASSSIPKTKRLNVYGRILLIISENPCYLVVDTKGSQRHLNIVSDFHTCSFRFFTRLNNLFIESGY